MTTLVRAASSLVIMQARMARWIEPAALRWRRPVIVVVHLWLIAASHYAAFWLRFDGDIPPPEIQLYIWALPILLLIRSATFYRLGLFHGFWRYTSLWDLQNIVFGVGLSTLAFYVLVHLIGGVHAYPRSVMLIDPLLLVCLMSALRLTNRVIPAVRANATRRRVLVIGAGDAAEMIVREMKRHPEYGCAPVGFVEDDPQWQGQRIHGVPVLGRVRDLVRIMLAQHPHEVLIAFVREEPAAIRAVVKLLEPFKVPLTRLPRIQDLVHGITVKDIRQLRVEDLLDRAPIGLDPTPVRRLIEGHRILVTGAGGSIGSELCRQIAQWSPARLVLYERYEGGLYSIESQLRDAHPDGPFAAAIGDVTDVDRLDIVLRAERPDIIFHAAAHKHVPLMETNPCEAVKNNVVGTLRVADAAVRHGVGAFVLVSTDKAVHPSSVMGASKRIAELIVQHFTRQCAAANGSGPGTRFVTVRFGNVLGSSGSVVPRFLEQVRAGGPVTVTHPEIKRFFMLIPEAVELVLQAAAIGEAGGVYVLDMGEQIKLLDMARNVIRLSGYVPDEDIGIRFTGLRPGEKLSERLVSDDEVAEPSPVEKILKVRESHVNGSVVPDALARLTQSAVAGDVDQVLHEMGRIVPTYRGRGLINSVLIVFALLGLHACGGGNKPAPPNPEPPGERTTFYVSPQGVSSNDGSQERPLDLETVLSGHTPVKPGGTVWLRGGTYRGGFTSRLVGRADAPIFVRAVPGERAVLDAAGTSASVVLNVLGAYTTFWGLEITSSNASRADSGKPSEPNGIYANESDHIAFVNLIVHDLPGQGIGLWSESVETALYGTIVYYNGTNHFDHGLYTQNANGTKRLEENIIFGQASHGIHAYGSSDASLDRLQFIGNVVFNNGLLVGEGERNILVGGLRVAHDLTLIDNLTYYAPASAHGSNNIGFSAGCANATLTGNYFAGPNALTLVNCAPYMLVRNVLVGGLEPPDLPAVFPDNQYSRGLPAGVRVIVRPNRFERGRAHVIVYNWDKQPQVSVDLSNTGLNAGQRFEIRDVQDLFAGPLMSSTYTGAAIALPMTGLRVAAPVWNRAVPPRHTAPDFAVFLVLPR